MDDDTSRRQFLASAAALVAVPAAGLGRDADASPGRRRMGVAITSYAIRWGSNQPSETYPGWHSALEVLDHCKALDAGGLQVGVGGWQADFAARVRDRREALGLYLEGQIALPASDDDVDRFDSEARSAREAGASVLRTAAGGRRYEQFDSAEGYRRFADGAARSLERAEPVARRHGVKLAVENHKDFRVPELIALIKKLGSEHFGVTLDFGNSIALLEDPMQVVEALAPLALSTHVKDMGVREYEQGFLLSEVPLGQGLLDMEAMVRSCERANRAVTFNLEMITRDPLKIPCLTDGYWATLADVPGPDLARTLAMVRARTSKDPLPQVADKTAERRLAFEEQNVRRCLDFAQDRLGMTR